MRRKSQVNPLRIHSFLLYIIRDFVKQNRKHNKDIRLDFLINHVSGNFVEMVLWWIKSCMKQTPAELDRYFSAVICPKIITWLTISVAQIRMLFICPTHSI